MSPVRLLGSSAQLGVLRVGKFGLGDLSDCNCSISHDNGQKENLLLFHPDSQRGIGAVIVVVSVFKLCVCVCVCLCVCVYMCGYVCVCVGVLVC